MEAQGLVARVGQERGRRRLAGLGRASLRPAKGLGGVKAKVLIGASRRGAARPGSGDDWAFLGSVEMDQLERVAQGLARLLGASILQQEAPRVVERDSAAAGRFVHLR
jgi:hypothetical protein